MPRLWDVLKSKLLIAALVLVVAAVVFRIMLPGIVLDYVNQTLAGMEDYRGQVRDIRMHLWRGAYEIIDVNLERTGGKVPVPFIHVDRIDLSVQWSEIINLALVGEMTLYRPSLNFVKGPTKETSQTTMTPTWMDITKELFPFSINEFDVVDGTVHYRDFHSEPKIDVFLDRVYMRAANLTNSRSVSRGKFATIEIYNKPAEDDPSFRTFVELDTFAKSPSFSLRFSLKGLELTRMNDFFRAYGNFDVESGTFSLYSEIEATEGNYKGYAKPFFKNLKVVDWKKDKKSMLRLAWEAVVGAAASVLENRPTKRIATIVPIEGNFKDKDIDYWRAIGNLLRNAFIEAIKPRFEGITTDGKPGKK
jgi:hypothetical protein